MLENNHEIHTENGILRGVIHIPIKPINITVIIYHGYFSANRVGPARLYIEIARSLCNKGYSVVRFDCFGIGDSDGSFSEVTFDSFKSNFVQIYKYSKSIFPSNRFILLGHSFGANILCILANNFSNSDMLFLIAPEVKYKKGIDNLFDCNQLKEIDTQGWTIRKGLYINASFIKVLRSLDILNFAKCITNQVILIQGINDELYSIEGAYELSLQIKKCTLYQIENADHNFLDPSSKDCLINTIHKHLSLTYD